MTALEGLNELANLDLLLKEENPNTLLTLDELLAYVNYNWTDLINPESEMTDAKMEAFLRKLIHAQVVGWEETKIRRVDEATLRAFFDNKNRNKPSVDFEILGLYWSIFSQGNELLYATEKI